MLGAILVILITAVVLPWLFLIGGFVICTVVGWAAKETAEADHEGSELIELNV